jgi:hypothetical protein
VDHVFNSRVEEDTVLEMRRIRRFTEFLTRRHGGTEAARRGNPKQL